VDPHLPRFLTQHLSFLLFPGAQGTCANSCGQQVDSCSCHVTCTSLRSCCPDFQHFCLQVSPRSGTLMGGTDFVVLHTTFDPASKVVCRFNQDVITKGYLDQNNRSHCISPLLYETGRIPFSLSLDDGATFNHTGSWSAVHHSKVANSLKSVLVNPNNWQFYGTPGVAGALTMTWNSSRLPAATVNVEVWGYQETGEPYSDSWAPEWHYLYTLDRDVPNSGTFTFTPNPAPKPYFLWEIGMLRIIPSDTSQGCLSSPALWSPVHAMAWHLEEAFRRDSVAWSLDKCLKWHQTEEKLPNFLSEIADCPCTLVQARADTGRFHTDYGCDIEKGSVCTYHPGAVHCVRAIQGSPQYAAGQQCCYDATGAQILTGDSIGGSTPDRGHDWGSPPYKNPPRVPGFSHWLYDVVTFHYCCLWSDNCYYYFTHRPSSDCRTYKPPSVAAVFGDPHFLTFDGAAFTFNGKGEYILLKSMFQDLTVQGRTQPVSYENVKGTTGKATQFSAVAMQEDGSDVIEVRQIPNSELLEVLLNQEVLSFEEQSWMDLKGVYVHSAVSQNVTVMFPSGAGVEVRGRAGGLAVTVLLPEEFWNRTQGLLGVLNGKAEDDFMRRDGTVLPSNASPRNLFEFGANWAIENGSSLFTYDTEFLVNHYKNADKHDQAFVPTFELTYDPADPLNPEVNQLCGDNSFCKFDAFATRNLRVANATKVSNQGHTMLVQNLQPVISCGWLPPPSNGRKEGTTYLVGSTLNFSCAANYILSGSSQRTCQPDGTWSGRNPYCVSDNTLGIILGSVFGGLALIIMIVLIYMHDRQKNSSGLVWGVKK
uniref:Sushi domain containing 2 n=1 Tax=Latimeria chalumnae TaxID=7897 RepID=H3B8I1_LATCH